MYFVRHDERDSGFGRLIVINPAGQGAGGRQQADFRFAAKAAALLADVAQHPLFPESELARLKNDAERQLSISKSEVLPKRFQTTHNRTPRQKRIPTSTGDT